MADADLRALERRWRASGSEDDYRLWLAARSRVCGFSADALRSVDALRERGAAWALDRVQSRVLGAPVRERGSLLAAVMVEAFGPKAAPLFAIPWAPGPRSSSVFVRLVEEATLLALEAEGAAPRRPDWRTLGEAVARVVAEETAAEDAWYGEVDQRLEDTLTALGLDHFYRFDDLAECCFSSWVMSESEAQRYGCSIELFQIYELFESRYGAPLPLGYPRRSWLPAVPEGEGREATLPHLLATLSVDWEHPPERVAAALVEGSFRETGAQERYQSAVDAPSHRGDGDRGTRFDAALAEARRLADRAGPLDFGALRAVQGLLLGGAAPVRTRPALARGGEEVYAAFAALEALLEAKVGADLSDACHPVVRAGRLYLDVIFLHPFEDGNARAARLALELVLRRAGLPTPELFPLVRMEKRPGDPESYWSFIAAIADGMRALA